MSFSHYRYKSTHTPAAVSGKPTALPVNSPSTLDPSGQVALCMEDGGNPICACGQSFVLESAFSNHTCICDKSKKRMSSALSKAQELFRLRKRRRLDPEGTRDIPLVISGTSSGPRLAPAPSPTLHDATEVCDLHSLGYYRLHTLTQPMQEDVQPAVDDSHLRLVDRRPWTYRLNRRPPAHIRDNLPQPPPPIPPSVVTELSDSEPSAPAGGSGCATLISRALRFITTERNIFGLARKYFTRQSEVVDPEEQCTLQDLSDIPAPVNPDTLPPANYHPYPNCNVFLLGEWNWTGGIQKSQATFRDLVNIVGDDEFLPSDVRDVNWDRIDKELGDDEVVWLDKDAGWTHTPVSISVPYQPQRRVSSNPQARPRDYVVENFHHKSLVSVIREKITHLRDPHYFHFEPYELSWQPPTTSNIPQPVQVQGELYTSPAFIHAHKELQEMPGEPGCDLQRVVIALMFWSDATHLTSFGSAKLWPLYLFFGNESKYRRCKPSSNSCEHVAYFQTVS